MELFNERFKIIQQISNLIDSAEYKAILREALEDIEHRNHKLYFVWCYKNKRTWSDSMAFWCIDRKPNLTEEMITRQWILNGNFYRQDDLAWKVNQIRERAAQKQDPNYQPVIYEKKRVNYKRTEGALPV